MHYPSEVVRRAISQLTRLPGIGQRSAQRIVFHLLKVSNEEVGQLSQSLVDLKQRITRCSICHNITEGDPCEVCRDPTRDTSMICVVEEPNEVLAIESTRHYRGLYHVLGGVLSPLDGVGPDDIRAKELVQRVRAGVQEVIVATNPSAEGEATAIYLSKLLGPLGTKVTRIARGLPMGGDLEFADQLTLARALEGRSEL